MAGFGKSTCPWSDCMGYAAPVWVLYHVCNITRIEEVKKFALQMCYKQWDAGYYELLNMFGLPSFENRHLYLKLCQRFRIIHNLCYYPPGIVALRTIPSHSYTYILQQPFARTNSSFVPDSTCKSNKLATGLLCTIT